MSEHIEDHKKLYEAARSLRKTGMPLSWRADEISAVLDELIRLRHIVASGIAVSINQESKELRYELGQAEMQRDTFEKNLSDLLDFTERLKVEHEAMSKDAWRHRFLRQHGFDIGSYHGVHEHNAAAWFEHISDESIDRCIADEAEFAAQFEVKS